MNCNNKSHRQVSRMFDAPIEKGVFRTFNGLAAKPDFYQYPYTKNIWAYFLRDYRELFVMCMFVNNI